MLERPAVTITDADPDGGVLLQVFWAHDDHPTYLRNGGKSPSQRLVPPHREPAGEMGVIEKMTPKPDTWNWPPHLGRAAGRGG